MTDQLINAGDDFAAIQADAELLDALAAGTTTPEPDSAAALLLAWRSELDDVLPSTPTVPLQRGVPTTPKAPRRRRHTAAVVAAAFVLAASTGVAAAATQAGPLGSLHRSLFGGGSHDDIAAK